jgi:protein gp37
MAYPTGIEWTDATWNPIGGCSIASSGCINCYAQDLAGTRLAHLPLYAGTTDLVKGKHVFNGKLTMAPDNATVWRWPLSWRGAKETKMGSGMPSMIFVGDMADLFHEDRSEEHIDRVYGVINAAPRHVFQVLTKRPQVMRKYLTDVGAGRRFVTERDGLFAGPAPWPMPNVWCGISAEPQQEFDARWPHLEATPAAVRFVSYEPMLGPLVLGDAKPDWVIAGCESGDGARPYQLDWVRSIRDQCQAAGIAFFLKQLTAEGRIISLPELDGRQWRVFPATRLTRAAA